MGRKAGVAAATAAATLNAAVEWSSPVRPFSNGVMAANEALRFAAFLAVAWIAEILSRQQRVVTESNRRMKKEMEAAQEIQRILVGPTPRHPHLEAATFMQPSRTLGGDMIHLSIGPEDRLAIAISDVSGKGSPAALAGAVLVGLLEDSAARYDSPGEALRYLDRHLAVYLPDEMFITMFYGILDLKSGDLTYSSAGHEPPFLLDRSGKVDELMIPGFPLGLHSGEEYQEGKAMLSPGDLLFCYTDGLPDLHQPDGDRLGSGKLARLLNGTSELACADLIHTVIDRASGGDWEAEIEDDVTMVAIRYIGVEQDLSPAARGGRPGFNHEPKGVENVQQST